MEKIFKFLFVAIALFSFSTVVEAQEPVNKKLLLNIVRKVKPEHVGTLRDSFLKCRVETLKEPGCIKYEIFQSPSDSTVFFIYEIWKDEESHKFHSTTPHLKIHAEECRDIYEPGFKGEFHRILME